MEWQGIESAPRNGTHLLGWWGGRVMAVFYLDEHGNPYDNEGTDFLTEPTHRQTLPEPPK